MHGARAGVIGLDQTVHRLADCRHLLDPRSPRLHHATPTPADPVTPPEDGPPAIGRTPWGAWGTVAAGATAALSACGGGGGGAAAPTPAPTPALPPALPSASEASRFLVQASLGADRAQIARVQTIGYAAWLDEQFALPLSTSRCDWLVAQGYDAAGTNNVNKNGFGGFDACAWRKLLSSPDVLRQRVTLALSEILVTSILGLAGGWRQFAAARYLDLLEENAFGNYRTLLQAVSTCPAMGEYLTFRGNLKANAATGALPDENYARELMQLFTIGLVQLNLDGTPKLLNGKVQETYGQDDITGLARIFTGWDWDTSVGAGNTPDFQRRPMVQVASRHETGAASFLGATVPAGTDGAARLGQALDIIFAHPNLAPFVSRQLIQRLVTSNPAPAYVQRVATVFLDNGQGVKGDLKAVVRAILLDSEARSAANLGSTTFGKLREPILRFVAWARAFGATSPSDAWAVGDTSDPASRLGQSPLRASSVFNFFRPGYTPPNSPIGAAALVAPEFQITNESSVVGYVNFMQTVVASGVGDVKADYSALVPLADNAQALLEELNTVLAAGQIDAATLATLRTALDTMASGTATARNNRIYAALVLVLASPQFLVQK
jgi:uncharacterized protein (DUF1800 family)